MVAENIRSFNIHVLRAIAALYKAHPQPESVTAPYLLGYREEGEALARAFEDIDENDLAKAQGALSWLKNNGLVTGRLEMQGMMLFDAQLTARSYRVLSVRNNNIQGPLPLGEAAVDIAEHGSEAEQESAGETVVRALS